jgi:hypothetical protein
MLATGTGLCVATLASGGMMLVPCAVSTAAGGATTLVGAGITAVSTLALKTSTGNQGEIARAVEGASGSLPKSTPVFRSPSLESLSPSDAKLQNLIKDLYKGATSPNKLGAGSTADAIRNELATGLPTEGVFHSQKGVQYSNGLRNWMNDYPNSSLNDKRIATSLLQDLTDALQGK